MECYECENEIGYIKPNINGGFYYECLKCGIGWEINKIIKFTKKINNGVKK